LLKIKNKWSCTKLLGGGGPGGSKNRSLGNYLDMIKNLNYKNNALIKFIDRSMSIPSGYLAFHNNSNQQWLQTYLSENNQRLKMF